MSKPIYITPKLSTYGKILLLASIPALGFLIYLNWVTSTPYASWLLIILYVLSNFRLFRVINKSHLAFVLSEKGIQKLKAWHTLEWADIQEIQVEDSWFMPKLKFTSTNDQIVQKSAKSAVSRLFLKLRGSPQNQFLLFATLPMLTLDWAALKQEIDAYRSGL